MMSDDNLLSLPALAEALKLSERWIKAEAEAGRIPHLKIEKRYRFNRETVVAVLAHRAAQDGKAISGTIRTPQEIKAERRFEASRSALIGILSAPSEFSDRREYDYIARVAVAYADALLAELDK